MNARARWKEAIREARHGDPESLCNMLALEPVPFHIQRDIAALLPKASGRKSARDRYGITPHNWQVARAVVHFESYEGDPRNLVDALALMPDGPNKLRRFKLARRRKIPAVTRAIKLLESEETGSRNIP